MATRFIVQVGSAYTLEDEPGSSTSGDYSTILWLEAQPMSVTSNGEIGEVRILAHKPWEQALAIYTVHNGDVFGVKILDTKGATMDSEGTVVFDGVMVKADLKLSGEQTAVMFVAYNNADYLLHRIALHGQQRRNSDAEQTYYGAGPAGDAIVISPDDLFEIDTPLIFNPDGQPNCSAQSYYYESVGVGNTFYIFDAPGRYQRNGSGGSLGTLIQSVPWTLSKAISYLFAFYSTDWAIHPLSVSDEALAVFTTNGNPEISNVNLEGKSFLEALRILCEPHNYIFSCDPDLDSGFHDISFSYRGAGTSQALILASRGTDASDNTSTLISADICFDTTPIVNAVDGYGAQIEFTTLASTTPASGEPTLVKGWETDELVWATNPDGTVNTIDPKFRKNYCNADLITPLPLYSDSPTSCAYGIGRTWFVNMGEVPTSDLEDLTSDFGGNNSIDPRRFEKPEIYNRNSAGGLLQQEQIQVEMSFDNGANWDICEPHWYKISSDNMSITFTDRVMETLGLDFKNNDFASGQNYWQALHSNKLQIRILCAIKSDERVKASLTNDGVSCYMATQRVYNNDGYKRVVYNSSVPDSVYYTKYPPLETTQNDTTALMTMVEQQRDLSDRLMISGQVSVLLGNVGDWSPGDCVSGITGRSITFDPQPTVLRVIYDFQNQHVHLVLDNHEVKTLLRAKPLDQRTKDEQRLGIEGVVPAPGARKVPYLPGINSSYDQYIENQAGMGE